MLGSLDTEERTACELLMGWCWRPLVVKQGNDCHNPWDLNLGLWGQREPEWNFDVPVTFAWLSAKFQLLCSIEDS